MNLDDDLREAWQGVTPPPLDQITSHECPECDEIAAFFGGRPWSDFVDVDALRYNECALALFAPVAFHYYLPAFIRATLDDPVRADLIPGSIVSSLGLEFGPAGRERLRWFTPAQRAGFTSL